MPEFETDSRHGLTVGEEHALSIGLARVTGFYEEDGLEKVRVTVTPFDPEDGKTPLEGAGEILCSMPAALFFKRRQDFETDQAQRAELARRKARRSGRQ